jgi:hypothetical protein
LQVLLYLSSKTGKNYDLAFGVTPTSSYQAYYLQKRVRLA